MTEQWQELKETITELRDNDGTGTQQDVCKFLVNYMDVLEKQMQEPKWIPVGERLPQINEWVVCQCRANIYEVLKFTSYGWYHDDAHCYMNGFVIAWMPLPKPYDPQEREEV